MKKITRRSFITVCGAAAAAMALTACGGAASSTVASSAAESTSSSAAAETAAGTLSGNVATGGSTSMKNVIAALTEGFAEVEPGVTVSYDPTGSGAGITGATDKTLDIGLSSSPPFRTSSLGRYFSMVLISSSFIAEVTTTASPAITIFAMCMYSLISNVPLLVRLATIRPHHEEVGAVVDIKPLKRLPQWLLFYLAPLPWC